MSKYSSQKSHGGKETYSSLKSSVRSRAASNRSSDPTGTRNIFDSPDLKNKDAKDHDALGNSNPGPQPKASLAKHLKKA